MRNLSLGQRWRRAPAGAVRLAQPRRFHLLVYINALTLGTILFVLAAQLLIITPDATQPVAAAASNTARATTHQTTTTPAATNQFAISATVNSSPRTDVERCASATYHLPAQLANTGRASGLYITRETPATYPVHGSSSTTVMNSIARCSPIRNAAGTFAATTGYAMASYYGYAQVAGICRVTSVIVMLHINQLYPQWSADTGTPAAMYQSWNSFMANLQAHEQGHVNLDTAAARNLYTQLQTLQAPTCNALQILVSTSTQSAVHNLNIANDNYDAATKHGTTQGAVL